MVATLDRWETASTLPREASYEQKLEFFGIIPPYPPGALDANIARKRRRWNYMSNSGIPSGRAKVAEVLALIQRTSQTVKRGALDDEGGGVAAENPARAFETVEGLWRILTEYVFADEYDDALRVAREAVNRWHNADAASALAWVVTSLINGGGFSQPQLIAEGLAAAEFAGREQAGEVRNWESIASLLLASDRPQEAVTAIDDAEHATGGQVTAMLYVLRTRAMAVLRRPDEAMVAAMRAVTRAAPEVASATRSELADILTSWAATLLPIQSSADLASYTEMIGVAVWCAHGVPEAEDLVRPYWMWAINAGKRVFIGSHRMRSFLAVITGFISIPIHNYLRSKPAWQVFRDGFGKPPAEAFFIVAAPAHVQKIHNVNLGIAFLDENVLGMAGESERPQEGGGRDTVLGYGITTEEIAAIAAEVTLAAAAALSAYGLTVLTKAKDDLADATVSTVSTGRRALQRIFGLRAEGGGLPVVLAEVIENPGDEDYLAALRLAIRKALQAGGAQLLADVREITGTARPDVTVTQTVTAGRDAYVAGRDQMITRSAKYAVDVKGGQGLQVGDGNVQRNYFRGTGVSEPEPGRAERDTGDVPSGTGPDGTSADQPGNGGGRGSGPPSPEADGVSPGPRYLLGRCPDVVPVGRPFSLIASIAQAAAGAAAQLLAFSVPPEGQDVLLVVHAPGLRLVGEQRLTVRVPADGDSSPVMFELQADREGLQSVSITAWHGGSYLGELLVEVTAGADGGRPRDYRAEIGSGSAEGAVSLVVRYDTELAGYRFEFRDVDNPGEVVSRLSFEPRHRIEGLVADLDRLASGRAGYSAAQANDYLVNAGAELWRDLVPPGLREQFWDRQHRIRQLTILADRDTVPWELLYPKDPGHDEGFLVQQFPVTRAIFGRRPAQALSLHPSRFVLPRGSLPEAGTEIDAMRALLDPSQGPGDVISELTPLQDLIRAGNFGLLHFACHNRFQPDDDASIKLGSVLFTPRLMTTAVIDKVLAGKSPMVFMNACRSAGLAPTYNRLDGWATRFLEAGAGAFIGSLWAVSDGTAREFAEELYGQLKSGATLGGAMMGARARAAEHADDPTWLAYSVYGDPGARVISPHP
jgi:CHAT domain